MEALSKSEFVTQCIKYQEYKKIMQEKEQKRKLEKAISNNPYYDIMGHIVDNCYRIKKRCRKRY